MVTPPDIEAQILRFYHAEKWTMGTIARQLHIHHSVVRRVLAQAATIADAKAITAVRVSNPGTGSMATCRSGTRVPNGEMSGVCAHAGVRSHAAAADSAAPNRPAAKPSRSTSASGRPDADS